MVLAKRPSIADFLVAEGALQSAVQLLLKGGPRAGDPSPATAHQWACLKTVTPAPWPDNTTRATGVLGLLSANSLCEGHLYHYTAGDQQTADVAVAAVWGLVKGNQKLLRPEAEALGAPGTALAGPLLDIVLRGKVRSGAVAMPGGC